MNMEILNCIIKTYIANKVRWQVSWLTFIRYDQNRKIRKPINFKVLGAIKPN
jgi:hypothetical protein